MRWNIFRRAASAAVSAALLAAAVPAPQALAAGPETGIPILTYHDLTRDADKTDSMTITDERFRLDMEFLGEYGYTPLLPADLIAIRSGEQEMPDKPVMVTFDDGYLSNYEIAFPILQQTGMKAVISVVAYNMKGAPDSAAAPEETVQVSEGVAITDPADPTRRHLTWAEMREMVASGLVEIGSHTYNLHNPEYGGMGAPDGINGVMRRPGESFAQYSARVGADLQQSIEMIRDYTGQQQVNYFAYPFGAYDKWMDALLDSSGVAVSVWSNNGRTASIAGGLRNLPRYGIRMGQSVAQLLRQTDTAQPALATVSVNGVQNKLPAYNINGSNYVRVRDVAVLLMGTASGFDVQWDSSTGRVGLASFTPYTPIGTENKPLPAGSRTVQSYTEPTVVDGTAHLIAAYQFDGYTYYKLRSLGGLCGFAVEWNEETQMVEVTA